jgi:3-phenylpropionate/cinnamic acid dioxygenase small subunit
VTVSLEDRAAITELLAGHGHLFDDGKLDRLDALFTASVSYDVTAFGGGVLCGIEAIRSATLALGDRNPVGHHVTNVVLAEQPDGSVRARSKGIGVYADGTAGSVTYEDTVVRTDEGWRIEARTVVPRRTPLSGTGTGTGLGTGTGTGLGTG